MGKYLMDRFQKLDASKLAG